MLEVTYIIHSTQPAGIFLLWLGCYFLDVIVEDKMLNWRAYYKSGEFELWYFSESQKGRGGNRFWKIFVRLK